MQAVGRQAAAQGDDSRCDAAAAPRALVCKPRCARRSCRSPARENAGRERQLASRRASARAQQVPPILARATGTGQPPASQYGRAVVTWSRAEVPSSSIAPFALSLPRQPLAGRTKQPPSFFDASLINTTDAVLSPSLSPLHGLLPHWPRPCLRHLALTAPTASRSEDATPSCELLCNPKRRPTDALPPCTRPRTSAQARAISSSQPVPLPVPFRPKRRQKSMAAKVDASCPRGMSDLPHHTGVV